MGATGIVGQRMIALLEDHPWFFVAKLGASPMSVGSVYGSIVRWRISDSELSPAVASLSILPCSADQFMDCSWVFSALDTDLALAIEPLFKEAGLRVFSNSAAYRLDTEMACLVVPTANPGKLARLETETGKNKIVANTNCTTSGIAVVLAALAAHRPASVMVNSMQAVSGAGISPGISFMDISDNVIPFIAQEEEKIEQELACLFPGLKVSAQCNRVNVSDGHMVHLAISLSSTATTEAITDSLAKYSTTLRAYPTSPKEAIVIKTEVDRPQPKLDRMNGKGMSVTVGRIRPFPLFTNGIQLTLLLHNTILGAAGSALLNAEILWRP